ncbi:MAG: hypothetical protein ABI718_03410 [Acidobacteriota bacterium]
MWRTSQCSHHAPLHGLHNEDALALGRGTLIVISRKKVAGVISDHDLRAIPEVDRATRRVTEVFRTVPPLSPDDTVKEAANMMRSREILDPAVE